MQLGCVYIWDLNGKKKNWQMLELIFGTDQNLPLEGRFKTNEDR